MRTPGIRNKSLTALAALLLAFAPLAGCGRNAAGPEETSPAEAGITAPGGYEDNADSAVIRADEDGLVTVRVEDGKAELSFDLEKWSEKHNILELTPDISDISQLNGGPFEIEGLSGRVSDACVGKVGALDNLDYKDFVFPAVMLLMEDGSLEWTLADPLAGSIYSLGKLPWLKDVVSLSYEAAGEGPGYMSVYAEDAGGLRYDTAALCALTQIFDYYWAAELPDNLRCTLEFSENGGFTLGAGWAGSEATDSYSGSYTVSLGENAAGGQGPGVISFDIPSVMSGRYFFEADAYYLSLRLADGDAFCVDGSGSPIESYDFWQPLKYPGWEEEDYYDIFGEPAINEFSDDELIDYLLANVEEAYELVYVSRSPLVPLVTGETIFPPDEGGCREVWLGAYNGGDFEREKLYAVSEGGMIYEYFPDTDEWGLMYVPGAVG